MRTQKSKQYKYKKHIKKYQKPICPRFPSHFSKPQDTGEFNIATSSLHALSNSMIMSRAEKPSPHSSPRMARRSQTPSVCSSLPSSISQQSDIYSAQSVSVANSQQQSPPPPLPPPPATAPIPSTPSMQSINGGGGVSGCHSSNCSSNSGGSSNSINNSNRPIPASAQPNRMSAPTCSSSANTNSACHMQPINKVLNKALSVDLHDLQDQIAPPLPPRKSSPAVSSSTSSSIITTATTADNATAIIMRPLKPQMAPPPQQISPPPLPPPQHHTASIPAAHVAPIATATTNAGGQLNQSSENITFCEFDVPSSVAPPIPKHNVVSPPLPLKMSHQLQQQQQQHAKSAVAASVNSANKTANVDELEGVVGPAETFSMQIDTRTLEERIATTAKAATNLDRDPSDSNNLYQMKNNSHARQQSNNSTSGSGGSSSNSSSNNNMPGASAATTSSRPSKSMTTPHFGTDCLGSSSSPGSSKNSNIPGVSNSQQRRSDPQPPGDAMLSPLLYENVTINNKDCSNNSSSSSSNSNSSNNSCSNSSVPYENINLEYIARLMKEGYSKEKVILALGISRNNIEMACDILHEFVSKHGQQH